MGGCLKKECTSTRALRRIAKKLGDPAILNVHFHSFRYWVGTHEWHKTKDPLHVQAILGHKNIEMTRKYVKMPEAIYSTNADDDFHTKVATTQSEIVELLNSGFEYVMQKDGLAYFRKRK